MIFYDVYVILAIMFLYIVVPGIPLAYLFLGKKSWAKILAFASIFGTMQFYVIYFALKNGLAELYISTIFLVLVLFFVPIILIIKHGERRFVFRFGRV